MSGTPKKALLQSATTDEKSEITGLLRGSNLNSGFHSQWLPAKIQLIHNAKLEVEYKLKKDDMLLHGVQEDDLYDSYGFAVENTLSKLELIPRNGLQVGDSDYNVLGYNSMGVYICQYADICLRHALITHATDEVMRLVIYKYVTGRRTTAIPRAAAATQFIEPTKGFDSHVSFLPPGAEDSLQNQFDRSQVYLYDFNNSVRPRHVLPYAIVSYTIGGHYLPAIDAIVSCSEDEKYLPANNAQTPTDDRLASNPRLKQIVDAINSKTIIEEDKQPWGGVANTNQGNNLPSGLSPGKLSMESMGKTNGNGSHSSHSPSPEVESLQDVISRINARYKEEQQGLMMGGRPPSVRGKGVMTPPLLAPSTVPRGMVQGVRQPALAQNRLLHSPPQHHSQHFTPMSEVDRLDRPARYMQPSTQVSPYHWHPDL